MLTVIILSKNEEDVIEDCVKSIRDIAGEILVIDSGSTDTTVEIAEKLGATIIKHTFVDFSDQRNFAFQQAHGEWILYLDADERATEPFKSELKLALANWSENSGIGGFFIHRKTYFLGKDWGLQDKVQRFFYKKRFIEWFGPIHETPKVKGNFGEIKSPVFHFTHRNLFQMLAKTNDWSEFEADLRMSAHHPDMNIARFIRVMATGFLNSFIGEKGYKNGTAGLIESVYQSFSLFVTYAKLWERQNKKGNKWQNRE